MIRRTILIAVLAATLAALTPPATASAATTTIWAWEDRAAPCRQSATCSVEQWYVADYGRSYTGWARIQYGFGASCNVCNDHVKLPVEAYRWANGGWVRDDYRSEDLVYIAPFGSGWVWSWTRTGGWKTMRMGGRFGSGSLLVATTYSH